MLVHIEKCEISDIPSGLADTKIREHGVRFFLDAISESSEFKGIPEDGGIYATFFKGSEFETSWVARIQSKSGRPLPPIKAPTSTKGIFVKKYGITQDSVKEISTFTRNSETLGINLIKETTKKRGFVVDSGSFGYIAPYDDQFYRVIIAKMLAMAYIHAIERQNTKLRISVIKHIDENNKFPNKTCNTLKHIYEKTLFFNAGFYQKNPIKTDRHELSKVWAEIESVMRIDDRHRELNKSLSALTEWLRTEEDRNAAQAREEMREQLKQEQTERAERESRREAALNKRSYIISTFLAVISILLAILALPQLN